MECESTFKSSLVGTVTENLKKGDSDSVILNAFAEGTFKEVCRRNFPRYCQKNSSEGFRRNPWRKIGKIFYEELRFTMFRIKLFFSRTNNEISEGPVKAYAKGILKRIQKENF